MSRLLEIKKQIDALTAQLEATRAAEFEEQVAEIKERIEAYGIGPEKLFTAAELSAAGLAPRRVRGADGKILPPKYALNGNTWSGKGGIPHWYRDALNAGHTKESLLIKTPPPAAE